MCWSRAINLGFIEMGYPLNCLGGLSFLGGIAKLRRRGCCWLSWITPYSLGLFFAKSWKWPTWKRPIAASPPPMTSLTPLPIAPLSLNTPLESWSPSLLQDPPGASQSFDDPLGFWNTRSYLIVNQLSQRLPCAESVEINGETICPERNECRILQPSSQDCVEICNSFLLADLLPIKFHYYFNELKIIFPPYPWHFFC